jgi:CHAT domain-containing protein/tetratricopeptide (TPR) repeat protein
VALPDSIEILRLDAERRYRAGDWNNALLVAERMISLARRSLGDDHPVTIRAQLQLAFRLNVAVRYRESESLYHQIRATLERIPPTADSVLLCLRRDFAFDYGNLLRGLGRWKDAEQQLLAALASTERTTPPNYPVLLEILYHLVDLHKEQGMLTAAERYALRSVELSREAGNHRLYWYLTYLAEVKLAQGRFDEAERDFLEALADAERRYGPHHNNITTTLGDLGVLYQMQHRYREAEVMMRRVLQIRRATYKEPETETARCILNLGTLYLAMGRLDESEPLLREGLALRERFFPGEHYLTARAMNNLGRLLFLKRKYVDAEQYFVRAHTTAMHTLPAGHPAIARYADHISLLYATLDRWRDAAPYWRSARDIYLLNIMQNFPALSAREQARYLDLLRRNFERYYSWYLRGIQDHPDLASEMYDNRVAVKSLLLRSSRDFRRKLEATEDSTLHRLYITWLRLESERGHEAAGHGDDSDDRRRALDSLTTALNAIEHQLALRSSEANAVYPLKTHGWRDVQAHLREDEAVVEIIRFRHCDVEWTDSIRYIALIITPRTRHHPDLIELPDGNALETKWYARYRAALLPRSPDNHGMPMREYRASLPARLRELHAVYWAPIQQRLSGVRRVYLSDDGVYQQININTLLSPSGRYLVEDLDIRRVTNSIALATGAPTRTHDPVRNALILVRPDFQGDSDSSASLKNPSHTPPGNPLRPGMEWSDLRYTEEEGKAIHRRLMQKGWNVSLHMRDQATESWLRGYPPPTLIHVATHGFFLPDSSTETDVFMTAGDLGAASDPLLRSGLVFAGVHRARDAAVPGDMPDSTRTRDDGILLSMEASSLRLDGTELVVLSACETAAGAMHIGEGIYGLQRAFLIAGVHAVMMSLWSIDDHAAFSFMKIFYEEYLRDLDADAALRATQRALISDGILPCDWGAFTILRR